jgi:hypothetical protein
MEIPTEIENSKSGAKNWEDKPTRKSGPPGRQISVDTKKDRTNRTSRRSHGILNALSSLWVFVQEDPTYHRNSLPTAAFSRVSELDRKENHTGWRKSSSLLPALQYAPTSRRQNFRFHFQPSSCSCSGVFAITFCPARPPQGGNNARNSCPASGFSTAAPLPGTHRL